MVSDHHGRGRWLDVLGLPGRRPHGCTTHIQRPTEIGRGEGTCAWGLGLTNEKGRFSKREKSSVGRFFDSYGAWLGWVWQFVSIYTLNNLTNTHCIL